jgi:hypothetical protein
MVSVRVGVQGVVDLETFGFSPERTSLQSLEWADRVVRRLLASDEHQRVHVFLQPRRLPKAVPVKRVEADLSAIVAELLCEAAFFAPVRLLPLLVPIDG